MIATQIQTGEQDKKNLLQTTQASANTVHLTASALTHEQVDLIKRTICKDATDDELKLFLSVCNKKQLDPFTKQIYAVKRWDTSQRRYTMTFQTSIDGLRLTAERSGHYAGQLGPYWCDGEGNWSDIWLYQEQPFASKIAVLRDDFKEPLWQTARYDSFVQVKKDGSPNQFWSKMGEHQIAKVAEALAIRRAFPQETSGLYIPEEMPETEDIEAEEVSLETPNQQTEIYAATNPQKKFLVEVLNSMNVTDVGIMSEISRKMKEDGVPVGREAMTEYIKITLKPGESDE